jgi:ribosome-associated protein
MPTLLNTQQLLAEVTYKTSRSGGAGGQHVNKVSSKVELAFDVANSLVLTDEQKALITVKLAARINAEGLLKITEEGDRSQLVNKENVQKKFINLLKEALKKPKKRKPTKPSAEAKAERLAGKKKRSEVKENRRKLDF